MVVFVSDLVSAPEMGCGEVRGEGREVGTEWVVGMNGHHKLRHQICRTFHGFTVQDRQVFVATRRLIV